MNISDLESAVTLDIRLRSFFQGATRFDRQDGFEVFRTITDLLSVPPPSHSIKYLNLSHLLPHGRFIFIASMTRKPAA